MSDYISKSEMVKAIENHYNGLTYENVPQSIPDFYSQMVELADGQPTLDEKEIIRKAFERVVDKICDLQPFLTADGQYVSLYEVVQTIKKECGISE